MIKLKIFKLVNMIQEIDQYNLICLVSILLVLKSRKKVRIRETN